MAKRKDLLLEDDLLLGMLVGGSQPEVYLLKDDFSATLTAGNIHGTEAPGLGTAAQRTRNVTDTDSKETMSGGNLNIASHSTPAYADPNLYYGAHTRAFGRTLLAKVTPVATNGKLLIGWTENAAGYTTVSHEIFFLNDGRLMANEDANLKEFGGSYSTVPYWIAIVLRSTGAYYFYKVAGGNWILGNVLSLKNFANPIPVVKMGNVALASTPIDFIRIPQQLYIVPVSAYDTFTRANGALGSTETTGPDGQNVSARTWLGGATWQISTNKAVNTPTVGSELVSNGGFDSATTGWTAEDCSLASVAGGQSGNCLELTRTGGTSQQASQAIGTIGKWYKMSGYVKSGTSGDESAKIYLQQGGSPFGTDGAIYPTSSGSWVNYSCSGLATTATIKAVVNKATATAGTMLFDTVTAKELTLSELMDAVDTGNANVMIDSSVTRTLGLQAGVVVRLDSQSTPANFLIAYLDGVGNVKLDKCVSGTYTNLIKAAATYSSGAVLRVIANGSSVSVFYNNAQVGTTQTVSDAGILSNTKHGLFSTDSGNSLDALTIRPVGDGAYSGLNKWTR